VSSEAVKVLEATKQSLEKVHYEDGTRFLDVVRKVEGEPATWLTMGFLPGKEPGFDAGAPPVLDAGAVDAGPVDSGTVDAGAADAGVKDAGAPDAGPPPPKALVQRVPNPPPVRELRGNERADQLWAKFSPLMGTRALGTLDAEKLKELGLTDSPRKLEVTVAGDTRKFVVSKAQPGVIGAYLLDQKTNVTYLFPGTLLSELEPSSQMLVDRRLHAFKAPDFEKFTIFAKGKERTFVQKSADTPQWTVAAEEAADKPDVIAKNWHEKVLNRLVVTEVLGKGELPVGGAPQESLKVEYLSKGAKKGFVVLGFDTNRSMWARSENTASWVAVHQGTEETVLEAERLVEGR
jgi:hypothetical protein